VFSHPIDVDTIERQKIFGRVVGTFRRVDTRRYSYFEGVPGCECGCFGFTPRTFDTRREAWEHATTTARALELKSQEAFVLLAMELA
jgi:hypothetical protein